MDIDLPEGVATGMGSLPHRDPAVAVETALRLTPDLPFVPQLPRRSVQEGMLAQVGLGIPGVRVTRTGDLAVDRRTFDAAAPVAFDPAHPAWATVSAFASAAAGRTGPVKWQLCGPVTLALALVRGGAPVDEAFAAATEAVRELVRAVHGLVATAMPAAQQVVWLDEPALAIMQGQPFPAGPDVAVDAMSSALATLEALGAVTGVHCCGPADWPLVLGAGPAILSAPIDAGLAEQGPALAAHLEAGGWIAWGAVPTGGPLGSTTDRLWRTLGDLWCVLVRQGCDPALLRQRALVTPACGLAHHGRPQAEHVLRLAARLAERVHGQALAARFCLGA